MLAVWRNKNKIQVLGKQRCVKWKWESEQREDTRDKVEDLSIITFNNEVL